MAKLTAVLLFATLLLVACGGEDDGALASAADAGELETADGDDGDLPDSAAFVESEDGSDSSSTALNEGSGAEFDPGLERLPGQASTTSTSTTTGASGPGTTAGSTSSTTGSTSSTTGSSASGNAPISIGSPSCGSLGASSTRTAPFTGLDASIPANLPAVVVKVSNNSSTSRSNLIGLDQADIVFEERVEASATRFFSIFHSSLPSNVGPVRSGRTTDVNLVINLSKPVFAYSGSNNGIAAQLQNAASVGHMVLFPNTDSAPFARDSRYSAPENLFVSPAGLGACSSANPSPIFTYGVNNSGTAQAASSVSFSARSSFGFDWNGSAWVRSQSGSAHVTREGAALDVANVVVLFTPTDNQGEFVIQNTISSGEAWILRNGTVTRGSYSRERGLAPYTLFDGNGAAMNLARGQTWVVLAPAGTASVN